MKLPIFVMPAKAGIQFFQVVTTFQKGVIASEAKQSNVF